MRGARFTPSAAAAIVVANMIGTGVFTSLGFQLVDIQSGFVLLALWGVGGVTALCGALCYAELGAALPRSGGEYRFLSEIYHPMAGFISGWVSSTIGFAAPTALAALTFGSYLSSVYPALSPLWLATGLVIVLTAVHTTSHRNSGGMQSVLTLCKVLLILGFSAAALSQLSTPTTLVFSPVKGDSELLFSSAFAVSLIYVNYAYTGWNAATYISSELENPQRHLPLVLIGSTVVVALCYLLLNYVFLRVAPVEAMVGRVEIGYIAATHVFGSGGAALMGVSLAALLVSTVSAMIMAGPRVLHAIGEDYAALRWLGHKNADGIPAVAIGLQSLVTLVFLWTSSFERILIFAGATLALNTLFTVAGLFVLRWRQPQLARPYRTFAYPLPPLLYLGITSWALYYTVMQRPVEALLALGIILLGALIYLLLKIYGSAAVTGT